MIAKQLFNSEASLTFQLSTEWIKMEFFINIRRWEELSSRWGLAVVQAGLKLPYTVILLVNVPINWEIDMASRAYQKFVVNKRTYFFS